MRELTRSAIVPYSAEAMFDLVADVEAYPDFLPWCTGATVLAAGADEVTASLTLSLGSLRGSFTTCNRMTRPGTIGMSLVDGPFSELDGRWSFEPLGDEGSRIALHMRFAFSSPVKDLLLGPVFERSCNELVDAFVERAGRLHG